MRTIVYCLGILWCAIAFAEVHYVPVVAIGQGATRPDAIKAAQLQAIGQVSGELIDASVLVSKSSKETKGQSVTRTRDISSQTDSVIRGAIKNTRVIRVDQNAAGLFEAEIEAEVIQVAQSEQLKRRRIVIALNSGPAGADPAMPSAIRSATEAGLVASRKMAVLDRQESSAIESEVRLMRSEKASIEDRLKAMSLPTADLIAVISVEGIREDTNPLGQAFTEISSRVSVVDVTSRQIKFAKNMRSLYPGPRQAAMGKLGQMHGTRIAREILDFAFPIIVIGESDGVVSVSGGASQLKNGQMVKIYRLGKVLKDPYTGERTGQEETEVGAGEVISVEAAGSKVRSHGFSSKKGADYVVKVDDSVAPAGSTSSRKVSDSDW